VIELRRAAENLRGEAARTFYSMREVSSFFGLPLRTVAFAYEQLEKEGILNRIRGSRTLLEGKTVAPRTSVRAVVGIPVWLHAIVVSPYSRAFNLELEESLRAHGFVADMIFSVIMKSSRPISQRGYSTTTSTTSSGTHPTRSPRKRCSP